MSENQGPRAGESQNKIGDAWIERVEAIEAIVKAIKVEISEIAVRLKAVEEAKSTKK